MAKTTDRDPSHSKRTPEERAEHRRQYLKMYMRHYRAANADKTRTWRIHAAKNLLQREGYMVTGSNGAPDKLIIPGEDCDLVIVNPSRIFDMSDPAKDGDAMC